MEGQRAEVREAAGAGRGHAARAQEDAKTPHAGGILEAGMLERQVTAEIQATRQKQVYGCFLCHAWYGFSSVVMPPGISADVR